MRKIRLVSWDADLARQHARALKKSGFGVDASPLSTARLIGQFRDHPPDVILIDLDRLPSHGRAVAIMLRGAKSTAHLPIVFAGGLEAKIQRARQQAPWAVFTDWAGAAKALGQALKARPLAAAPGKSYMQQFARSSLVKKLDFKPNMRTALLGAPEGFEEQLGELPEGVELETKITAQTKMAIWFVRSLRELADTDYLGARLPDGASVWIVYPKQASRFKVDFTQHDVRGMGLAAGLVDYKICAVDSDWTGLKFTRKRS
jgi:CheY-like chemotaxis protein